MEKNGSFLSMKEKECALWRGVPSFSTWSERGLYHGEEWKPSLFEVDGEYLMERSCNLYALNNKRCTLWRGDTPFYLERKDIIRNSPPNKCCWMRVLLLSVKVTIRTTFVCLPLFYFPSVHNFYIISSSRIILVLLYYVLLY